MNDDDVYGSLLDLNDLAPEGSPAELLQWLLENPEPGNPSWEAEVTRFKLLTAQTHN